MKKILFFLPVLFLTATLFTSDSGAVIEILDIEADIRFSNNNFNSATVDLGEGQAFDYVLLACAIPDPNENNSFLPPSPGDWTEIDTGECGGDFSCIGGVWGRFIEESGNVETTCSWTQNVPATFAGGSMRLSGVDADPIIAVECDTGTGTNEAVAPSVETEAGSYVARFFAFTPLTFVDLEPFTSATFEPELRFEGIALNTFQFIASNGFGEFFEEAGPTDTFTLTFVPNNEATPISWRACTVALRMGTPPGIQRAIPTMSEWGFMAVAVFMGAAGVWYLRRRQNAA